MDLTVIVPARHEADNVYPLLRKIQQVTASLAVPTSVLFVDDSDDDGNTVAAIEGAADRCSTSRFAVAYYHRQGDTRWGSLAGAVVDGLARATAEYVVVMDGDGQHPAETIELLLKELGNGSDVAVASRYCVGGDAGGLNGLVRHLVSQGSNMFAKLLFPRALRGVSDPMTGFFAGRLDAIEPERLQRTRGFKILLEILVRHHWLNATEVPFSFGERGAEQSKSSLNQGLQFIRQLVELRCATIGSLFHLNTIDRTLTAHGG